MLPKTITATEFKNRAGQYIDESGKNPVYITKHNRPVRVLVDIDEYNRLKEVDTREHYDLRTDDIPEEFAKELEKGYQGEPTPHLDHLMD